MSDEDVLPTDQELHAPKGDSLPNIPHEAITLERYRELMKNRTRPLTMTEPIQRRLTSKAAPDHRVIGDML